MYEPNEEGRPHHGPASEDLAAGMQLDLTITDGTDAGDTRPRTDPDPSRRRRNMEEGRRRRDEGMAYAAANTPIGWRDLIDATIEEFAGRGVPFTADDVREVTGHPLGAPANAFGPPFQAAAKRGLIRKVGVGSSARPERHGGYVAVWTGTGARDG